jgi:hypothetical protein
MNRQMVDKFFERNVPLAVGCRFEKQTNQTV